MLAANLLAIRLIIGIGVTGIGVFCVLVAWKNWDWFFELGEVRRFVALIGRNPARVFYFIVGVISIVAGFVVPFMLDQNAVETRRASVGAVGRNESLAENLFNRSQSSIRGVA